MSFFHGTCTGCGLTSLRLPSPNTPEFGEIVVALVAAELGLRENNIAGPLQDELHNDARATVTWVMRHIVIKNRKKCTWAQCGLAIDRKGDSAFRSRKRWKSPEVTEPGRTVMAALASIREKASA